MQRDKGPSGARGLKGNSSDRGPAGSGSPTGKHSAEGSGGPVGAGGGIGACGEEGDKGYTGGVGQQGPVGPQGSTGQRGSQGAAGKIGPQGDRGAPAVEIDIVAELCKHLPIAIVEQYRRGTYARYAINSIEDVKLHDPARVKTIQVVIAMRVKVMLRGWLLFHKLESIVIMYLISIMMHTTWKQICMTFTIFACLLYTKLRLMQKSNIGTAII